MRRRSRRRRDEACSTIGVIEAPVAADARCSFQRSDRPLHRGEIVVFLRCGVTERTDIECARAAIPYTRELRMLDENISRRLEVESLGEAHAFRYFADDPPVRLGLAGRR